MAFELKIFILSGQRTGQHLSLHHNIGNSIENAPSILEDELLEFRLITSNKYTDALLKIYQHVISPSEINYIDGEYTEYIWKPNSFNYKERLFINYFGICELEIELTDHELINELIQFQPIQVLAKTESIKNVENMFAYLSQIAPEELYSVFSATKSHGKIASEAQGSPLEFIERLKLSKALLLEILPSLTHNPITRLEPQHKFIYSTGDEELSDSSISWLMENLSVLEPDENPDQAHIYYDDQHYRATTMYVPVLIENTDIYENQVIHGFVELLIRESQHLLNRYALKSTLSTTSTPTGYTSFFERINKFKSLLISTEINTITESIHSLRTIQVLLDKHIPVTKKITQRPIFTPKVKVNYIYRNIFIEIIKWIEKKSIDWSAYDYLFSINSLPYLFETYCYFRVIKDVHYILTGNDNISSKIQLEFYDEENNIEIKIEKEPNYWTPYHSNSHLDRVINSEGYTVNEYNNYGIRSQKGAFSKRQPDIVIQIKKNDTVKLLVLDAKYTREKTAFTRYLPDLTMKYVHGIHKYQQIEQTVNSLAILYPSEKSTFLSYHHEEMQIFGKYPVTPSLQAVGLILGENRYQDDLSRFLRQALIHSGIHIKNL